VIRMLERPSVDADQSAARLSIRRSADTGSVTLEIAVLTPALLLVIFGIIQGAFVFHARHVALAAASEGLAAATAHHAGDDAGSRAAREFLAAAGGADVLEAATVAVRRTPTSAEVTVSGRAPTIIPGVAGWTVTQVASGPVERFTVEEAP
jgi:Flp pilus assembly protein TadG